MDDVDNEAQTHAPLEALAYNCQRLLTISKYDIRSAAFSYRDIALATTVRMDENKAILNLALFLSCVRSTRLSSPQIAEWVSRQSDGKEELSWRVDNLRAQSR